MLPLVLGPLTAALNDKPRLDALLGWVAALMGGAPIARVARTIAGIKDPRLKAALSSPKPLANVQWVGGKGVPFKAFTTEAKGTTLKASGMAADDWLMQLEVSFDGKALSFERANVARAIEFIE